MGRAAAATLTTGVERPRGARPARRSGRMDPLAGGVLDATLDERLDEAEARRDERLDLRREAAPERGAHDGLPRYLGASVPARVAGASATPALPEVAAPTADAVPHEPEALEMREDGAEHAEVADGGEGEGEGEGEGGGMAVGRGDARAAPRALAAGVEGEVLEAVPQALQAVVEEPLLAPPLVREPLGSPWAVEAPELSALRPPAPQEQAEDPAQDKSKDKAQGTPQDDPAQRVMDARERRERDEQATSAAQQAWHALSREVQGEQDGFVRHADGLSQTLAQQWESDSAGILQAHTQDRDAIDQASTLAVATLEANGATAVHAFDQASRRTRAAIRAAGRSAYGLINAGSANSASQIVSVVSSLVAGHVQAFNDTIHDAQAELDTAMTGLNEWRDQRATHHSTETGPFLERAKNEKRQLRIPRWVEPAARQLQQRFDDKKQAWEQSRDNTSCSLTCSYTGALEAENTRMAAQSRCQVGKALASALDTLQEQTRAGRKALREITRQQVLQVQHQAEATRSRLHSQARGALAMQHRETQGAASGVAAAARSALPTYARQAMGFGQSLRDSAQRGEPTLRRTAERGATPLRETALRHSSQLQERLQANQQRHGESSTGLRTEREALRQDTLSQWQGFLDQQQVAASEQLAQGAASFTDAFAQLAGTVRSAATEWAQPLPVRMAQFIAGKRGEAATALDQLRTGAEAPTPTGTAPPPAPAGDCPQAEAEAGAPAADCGGCATTGGGGGGGAATGTGATAESAGGLDQQRDDEIAHYQSHLPGNDFFSEQLTQAGVDVEQALEGRANRVVGGFSGAFMGSVDETAVVAALRGMTRNQGRALDMTVYPGRHNGRWLDDDLREQLDADSDDYRAASAYLNGDNAAGAAIELADSTGIFNDDEARIEAVMRALSPEELSALGRDHAGTLGDVRDALDSTDLRVFDALAAGDHALADAERLRTAVTEARRDGDADATHRAIEQYTGAPAPGDWRAEQEMSADDRRTATVDALGGLLEAEDVARGVTSDAEISRTDRAVAFVTRDVEVYVGGGPDGGGQTVTLSITGANRDLAEALLRHAEDSVEVRAARLGVEIQRRGDPPDAVNIDRATFDPRFVGDLANATPEQRAAHRTAAAERARVLMLAAERYAEGEATPEDHVPASDAANPDAALEEDRVVRARERLIGSLEARFGANTTGADLAAGLLTDTRPTPETAALAMEHAMEGAGTNEALMFRFTERMDRDEIAAMRDAYRANTGRSLDADMGVYGDGEFFSELSGDDRLRMERALLGQPRNDRERLEVAAFALEQQRREASDFGAWLADGTLADEAMSATENELQLLAGGPFTVGARGEIEDELGNFDGEGRYTGPDVEHFRATAGVAVDIAQTYASRIDAFADIATTGIAILGAIAAAAISVVTMGAAAPLIAAAIVTGLASMSASYAIKGGRYGWEQAAVDLGMTAVQAITAGVGAQLGAAAQVASKGAAAAGAASRTITSLARMFTGNPVVDQIIVGMVSGSISGLGTAALDERTWEHGGDDAVGWLFAGLARGALVGGATAAATQSIEALARNGASIARQAEAIAERGGLLNRAAGGALGMVGRTADSANRALNVATGGGAMGSLGAMGRRGLTRGLVQAAGGVAGRGTELAFDSATGRFKGDMGDALLQMGQAGLQSFAQGIGEGGAEAFGQSVHNGRLLAAAERINEARREMGMADPIPGDALTPGSPLRDAAEDLLFMQMHGRFGSDGLGRALSLEHIAQHGGMAATVVTRFPDAIVEDGMRAALLRHVDPALHGDFADVPIRVLPEAEFRAATRSALGDAVTLIENGQPVVLVREGTSVARLSDEGPHLVQSRDAATRERVARLDEATLARWDELDLDTQIDLYRDKVDLEIDAHERIRDSLVREMADAVRRGDAERVARLAEEMAFNDGTLGNLRQRADDVQGLGAGRREALRSGREARPDYLDQPARLFSKRRRAADANEVREDTVAEIERQLPPRTEAEVGSDDAPYTLPDSPPEPEAGTRRVFDRTDEEANAGMQRMQRGNDFNNEREHAYPHSEVRLERPPGWSGHPRADAIVVGREIVERKFSQLSELSADAAIDYINQLVEIYHPGARIANVDSTAAVRAEDSASGGTGTLRGQMVLEVPEQHAPVPRRVLEHAERVGVFIRDPEGRVYSTTHPDGDDGVLRASSRDPDAHAAEMQAELMRHVPPAQRGDFADVPIVVMRDAEFRRFTDSERGEVVLIHRDGQPVVVVREGVPISRLSDEGPHLLQLRDPATAARAARLDEATLSRWHELDLDTQIELFRTKVELEIDAHERIDASLRARTPPDAAELARNAQTLHNLRQLQDQVTGLGPAQRDAIRADGRLRPPYLDQPARLFSKSAARPVRTVFEPFVGPGLKSPAELAERYPGAEVIAGEASHRPDAAAVSEFEAQGGRFVPDRFGESLPDNSVDRLHVRFPLPHEKALEMRINTEGRPFADVMAEIRQRQADIESVTNLAPHALRVLREGGEIEVVFDENSIHAELAAAQQLTWTDERGLRWRLEPTGPAGEVVRADSAPHSGFGVPVRDMANAMTLRKVRVPLTPEEQARMAETRAQRKRDERAARDAAYHARETRRAEEERVATQRAQALREREATIDQETARRLSDLREGSTTVDEDLRQRLLPVAASTRLGVDQLIEVIQRIDATLGISGRRIDAQEIIDSLRNRVREGRAPRYGELDGLVDELAVSLNAQAIAHMREHLRAQRPDAVLAVERGGALLADVLARDAPDFPETVTVAKAGPPGRERRTPLLEAEIRRRIEQQGQSHFAIVDFYMGGVFAGELRAMVAAIARDHPQVVVEVVWMRETHGFERIVLRPTVQELQEGVMLTGRLVWRNGRLVIEDPSPMVTLPPLQGTDPALPQLRATDVPVDIVLGDDMPGVLDRASTAPIRVFDREGRVVRVIPVGTPDPVTGEPLRFTRDIMVRLMQGHFQGHDQGHEP
ncbi:hypothetical protein [Hydrogenophaga sp. BPS33]|uniref:hypothetical protein n=1 Tax=Hydrogenophaga sp. BPS33 TaxID=2651974 RepID=UPI00131F93CA|nr:hypothetical protein [Hydrogenophaga sp. BPS33]QHE85174.1 annexin [Hydrogenophaga sp. BPS33]